MTRFKNLKNLGSSVSIKFFCAFCGADESAARMVTGRAGICICERCIGLAAASLARTSSKIMMLVATEKKD